MLLGDRDARCGQERFGGWKRALDDGGTDVLAASIRRLRRGLRGSEQRLPGRFKQRHLLSSAQIIVQGSDRFSGNDKRWLELLLAPQHGKQKGIRSGSVIVLIHSSTV